MGLGSQRAVEEIVVEQVEQVQAEAGVTPLWDWVALFGAWAVQSATTLAGVGFPVLGVLVLALAK